MAFSMPNFTGHGEKHPARRHLRRRPRQQPLRADRGPLPLLMGRDIVQIVANLADFWALWATLPNVWLLDF